MASDPTKPLLRLVAVNAGERRKGPPRRPPPPDPYPRDRQTERFGPKFERLADVLGRDPSGLALKRDPAALAPERLLVFEVRGPINNFASAVRRIPGLDFIDEEALPSDDDKAPFVYLLIPDAAALRQLLSVWQRWQRGQLGTGETPWRDVFNCLRDLRRWGPEDRVQKSDGDILAAEIADRSNDDRVRLEVELVFVSSEAEARAREVELLANESMAAGRVVSRCRLRDIAYHALLIELPVIAVRGILARAADSIAGLGPVIHIRPQSIATTIELDDREAAAAVTQLAPRPEPVLALLDGVPVAAHPLLSSHLVVDDRFDLESQALVRDRRHGTAMASLIVHGDRNRAEPALPRRIHIVPVLGSNDQFPDDRLIVDLIHTAVLGMRDGADASAPEVIVVNLSLGNARRAFYGQLSAWARLLDRLAYRFGILFIVSAGNDLRPFIVPGFATGVAFEDADGSDRSAQTLRGIGNIMADRRLFSPAETVNGLTIGACNEDAVSPSDRRTARVNVDPYPDILMANPSSTLGPGFANSVKPDFLMPGSRERLRCIRSGDSVEVEPAGPSRAAGLKVAAPLREGTGSAEGYTSGTSGAAALASRTAHRIHDALEATYGDAFVSLPHRQRAVVLKALLAHPAKWPTEAADLVRSTLGPADGRQHVRQKDNIRRFFGYGYVDGDEAVACAADRATFWATGTLEPEKSATVAVPIPVAMHGRAQFHALSATLAWFTPVMPGRRSYRCVRLKVLEPEELAALAVDGSGRQPDSNQANRGTLFSRSWSGQRAPMVEDGTAVRLVVQRELDQSRVTDEAVPFGLAVTIAMPGVIEIYDQVRARIAPQPEVRARGA